MDSSCDQKEVKLDRLEKELRSTFRSFPSDKVLLEVHRAIKESKDPHSPIHAVFPPANGGFQPFVAAGISAFSIRYSSPDRYPEKQVTLADLAKLYNLVCDFLTADPITTDEEVAKKFDQSNPVFMMLRAVAGQFPFEVDTFASMGQPLLLFGEIPKVVGRKKGVPKFEFSKAFENVTSLSLHDFVVGCFVAWSASSSKNTLGITRSYFEKARTQGINLPDDAGISLLLNSIGADPRRFRQTYDEMKQEDRRFRIYDFNPILTFPILRPWHHHSTKTMQRDRMIAPLPDLIAYRASTGIFYEMFNRYRTEFSEYFGHLFEAYTGRVLEASVSSESLISEHSIRERYPESSGKVPDWVVLDGSIAILIECKATRFSLTALSTGAEESVDYSLKQVLAALRQLHEFRQAVIEKATGLERFHHCSEIKSVVVTFEPLYLINSVFFRDHINRLLLERDNITGLPWRILSVKELECLQAHLGTGISFAETLTSMEVKNYHQVLQDLQAKTRLTYKDSMIYQFDREMFERLRPDGGK